MSVDDPFGLRAFSLAHDVRLQPDPPTVCRCCHREPARNADGDCSARCTRERYAIKRRAEKIAEFLEQLDRRTAGAIAQACRFHAKTLMDDVKAFVDGGHDERLIVDFIERAERLQAIANEMGE